MPRMLLPVFVFTTIPSLGCSDLGYKNARTKAAKETIKTLFILVYGYYGTAVYECPQPFCSGKCFVPNCSNNVAVGIGDTIRRKNRDAELNCYRNSNPIGIRIEIGIKMSSWKEFESELISKCLKRNSYSNQKFCFKSHSTKNSDFLKIPSNKILFCTNWNVCSLLGAKTLNYSKAIVGYPLSDPRVRFGAILRRIVGNKSI